MESEHARWVLGRGLTGLGDHDRGDKVRTSTRGAGSNSPAQAHTPQDNVPRRWRLKRSHGGRRPICRPSRSTNIPETEQRRKASLGYARNLVSGITVAVPHMTLEGFFRPPSLGVIHFSFARLKRIRSCRRRAHSSANLRSRVRASLFVGWLLCEAARSSRLFRVLSIY